MERIIGSTYEIISFLGHGGGGNVYLANHLRLGKKVVVKEDRRVGVYSPEVLRREADVLKELKHPHIPTVFDFFSEGEKVYTVIDYIEGESLDRILKRHETIPMPKLIRWSRQLLEALSYLHQPDPEKQSRGYVHGDIKPANLMVTPQGDLCLIDFNIALSLEGEHVSHGYSAGYASPEHYGLAEIGPVKRTEHGTILLKKSSLSKKDRPEAEEPDVDGTVFDMDGTVYDDIDRTVNDADGTVYDDIDGTVNDADGTIYDDIDERSIDVDETAYDTNDTIPDTEKHQEQSLDARSDIYSVGATMYHLLTGKRPDPNAEKVELLSTEAYNAQIVQIITRAMQPDPSLRYQTAEEMLWDLNHLWENDPEMIRYKKTTKAMRIGIASFLMLGIAASFAGLGRMRKEENWLKMAEYSRSAKAEGDVQTAVADALEAVSGKSVLFYPEYLPQAEKALADALEIYDLSDHYEAVRRIELSSEPLALAMAPDGSSCAFLSDFSFVLMDPSSGENIVSLPAEHSALSEMEYLDADHLIYAGSDGISFYQISTGQTFWTGEKATAIAVSGDKSKAAVVYKDMDEAVLYDIASGTIEQRISFSGRGQSVTSNDIFANPQDNLLELNEDGTFLAVSFADGSFSLFETSENGEEIEVYDETSGFVHFEGGFYRNYLAIAASSREDSVFALIDVQEMAELDGFEAETWFHTKTDENGIYLALDDILVKLDPETGDQLPLAAASKEILDFAVDQNRIMTVTKENCLFYDENAVLISETPISDAGGMVSAAGGMAILGSINTPYVRVMQYQEKGENEEILRYDPSFEHDEARLSADEKTIMLFDSYHFRIYDREGQILADTEIPDAEHLYDQQYRRENGKSWLEATWQDGTMVKYSAEDGSILAAETGEAPDLSLTEQFETNDYVIVSPLHGAPEVYDLRTGKQVCSLSRTDYLTYVTQTGDYLIAQYITGEGRIYGQLMNRRCEVLADLPYLCDVKDQKLIFDDPSGTIREGRIYEIEELIEKAKE